MPPGQIHSSPFFNAASDTFFSVFTLSFVVLCGLARFLLFSICDTACPCSISALHFAVFREIELLSHTSHSCRLPEWLVVPVVIVLTHLLSVLVIDVFFGVFLFDLVLDV